MRQILRNRRGQRSAAGRQWRNHFNSSLVDDLSHTAQQLSGQVVVGWTLLLQDIAHASFDLRARQTHAAYHDAPASSLSEVQDAFDAVANDPLDVVLRQVAHSKGMRSAPEGFAAQVVARLPQTPPPLHPELIAFNPYATLQQHLRLVCGAVSFSAILSFLTSWLLATAMPSLGFALLATLVTLGLVLVEVLRTLVQMTAGAASNPVLVLVAMLGPLIVFLLACMQLARLSRVRLA